MKVLYINYSKSGSGSIVHTVQFFSAFQNLVPEAAAYTPLADESQAKNKSDRPGIIAGMNQLREIRFLVAAFFRRAVDEFLKIRAIQPDVVILRRDRYLSSIVLCKLMKIPLILEVNGPFLEDRFMPKKHRLRCFYFWKWLETKMLDMADHITVVSAPLKKYYIDSGISAEKLSIVPNGVDISKFHPAIEGGLVRQKYNLEGKFVVGFMGTFAAWHGLEFLIDMLGEFTRRCAGSKKIVLLLIGTAKYNFQIPEMENLTAVVTGLVPYEKIPEYLAAVDVFVAPYPKIEPFYFSPLKIIEAMAMGLPVLASSQGQISELITDGVNGSLYPPGDKAVFLKKLEMLKENQDKRAEYGRNACKTIIKRYTWHDNAETVSRLCRRYQKVEAHVG